MRKRIIKRYTVCFKMQVISELESGRFDSIEGAMRHYDIGGSMTIQKWRHRYGKTHLQLGLARGEMRNERDYIPELNKRIAELKRDLGQTQAENLLHATFLKLACQELGQDVDTFNMKADGLRYTKTVANIAAK
ncbi:MAG: transposase [Phycisphaerales bacterium]|nr:transposase [Phycisphaerales bacterium]